MSRPEPHEIAERLCATGESIGIVSVESTINLRWANGRLTTNGRSDLVSSTAIAIARGSQGRSTGSAAGTVLHGRDADDFVAAARQAAVEASPAEDGADLVAGAIDPDFDQPAGQVETADFGDLPDELSGAFALEMLLFGYAEFARTTYYVATSAGSRRRCEISAARFEITAKSTDRARSTWVGQAGRTFAEIDVAAAVATAQLQLEWQRRRVDLAPGRYDALLTPSATSDLIVDLMWSASAREAYEGSNAFAKPGGGTRVGERIGVAGLRLSSDPFDELLPTVPFVIAASGSPVSSVFDNGLPLQATDWIDDGVLRALLTTRHSASLAGLTNTPFIDNARLTQSAGHGDLAEVIARTDEAVLLNSLWYIRTVDPQRMLLTGLTRDGAYQIRGGEVVGAVSNFRFNESPLDLLGRVKDAGRTVRTLPRELGDYFPKVAMPPLVVGDFNLSTLSQAS